MESQGVRAGLGLTWPMERVSEVKISCPRDPRRAGSFWTQSPQKGRLLPAAPTESRQARRPTCPLCEVRSSFLSRLGGAGSGLVAASSADAWGRAQGGRG